MTPRLVPVTTIGIALVALALTATACSSSSDDSGSSSPATAATSTAGSSAAGAPASEPVSEAATSDCKTDSNYLSGTSTIVWTPDSKSKHQVAETKADNKFTLTADGTLDPATIEVAVDEVFTVTLAGDSKGLSVLKIGCDGGQTMSKGTPAGIYITTPGTYEVKSGITEKAAGTIKVS